MKPEKDQFITEGLTQVWAWRDLIHGQAAQSLMPPRYIPTQQDKKTHDKRAG